MVTYMNTLRNKVIDEHIRDYYPNSKIRTQVKGHSWEVDELGFKPTSVTLPGLWAATTHKLGRGIRKRCLF